MQGKVANRIGCFAITILLQRFELGDVDAGMQGVPKEPGATGLSEQRASELSQ